MFGVPTFFQLSAFLLTYRLLVQIESTSKTTGKIRIILKYFVTRFFRIYMPLVALFLIMHVVYAWTYSLNLGDFSRLFRRLSFEDTILQELQTFFLWTIPLEVSPNRI